MEDFGIRAIIGPSFAEIFFNNCFKNGILPIVLDSALIDELFLLAEPGVDFTVDLDSQTIQLPGGRRIAFEVDASRKHRLLNGLDDIGLTLQHAAEIRTYEQRRKQQAPWLYGQPG